MFPEFFREPLGCRPSRGLCNITPTTLSFKPALIPLRSPLHVDCQESAGLDAGLGLWNIWQILNIVAVYEVMLSPVSVKFWWGPSFDSNCRSWIMVVSLSAQHYPANNWLWRIVSICWCWVRFLGKERHIMDKKKKDTVCLVTDQQKSEIKFTTWDIQRVCVFFSEFLM